MLLCYYCYYAISMALPCTMELCYFCYYAKMELSCTIHDAIFTIMLFCVHCISILLLLLCYFSGIAMNYGIMLFLLLCYSVHCIIPLCIVLYYSIMPFYIGPCTVILATRLCYSQGSCMTLTLLFWYSAKCATIILRYM